MLCSDRGPPRSGGIREDVVAADALFGCGHFRGAKEKVSGGKANRRTAGKANRRMSNVEPQNVEGMNRCALSFLNRN